MQSRKAAFNAIQNEKIFDGPSVVTLGNFDGVHTGHRQLIGKAAMSAKKRCLPMVVVTFDPHPLKLLSPEQYSGQLMTLPQKLSVFESLGVDRVWIIHFGREFSELGPEAFLDGLQTNLAPVELHVGQAFRFGQNRLGDVSTLQTWGNGFGCTVHTYAFRASDGGVLSSSRIRRALADGDVGFAFELLGAPFMLTGVVVEGDRRGRRMGFPTANLAWEQELLPAPGVYVTAVHCPGHFTGPVPGLTNVGIKPTFRGQNLTVETHLPGIHADIYGARAELGFLNRLRGEEAFESPEILKNKIAEDVENGIAWWESKSLWPKLT